MTTISNPEGKLRDKCSAWLKQLSRTEPVWWVKVFGNAVQSGGVPDFVICYRGRFVGIELKRPDGKGTVDPRQRAVLDHMSKAGGITGIAESLEQFKELVHGAIDN